MENIGVLLNDDDVSIVSQAEEARKEFVLVEKKTEILFDLQTSDGYLWCNCGDRCL